MASHKTNIRRVLSNRGNVIRNTQESNFGGVGAMVCSRSDCCVKSRQLPRGLVAHMCSVHAARHPTTFWRGCVLLELARTCNDTAH